MTAGGTSWSVIPIHPGTALEPPGRSAGHFCFCSMMGRAYKRCKSRKQRFVAGFRHDWSKFMRWEEISIAEEDGVARGIIPPGAAILFRFGDIRRDASCDAMRDARWGPVSHASTATNPRSSFFFADRRRTCLDHQAISAPTQGPASPEATRQEGTGRRCCRCPRSICLKRQCSRAASD